MSNRRTRLTRRHHQFEAKRPKVYHFEITNPLTGSKVDAVNGVIKDVSIITGGVTARGHDLEVDDTTIMQMFSCAKTMGQVPVKWNHKTGADAINGFITNFYVDGNKLKGDWHLLQSHAQYPQAMELAQRMPKNFGLSAAFSGKEENFAGKKKARCEELVSVDLVANPAANPDGLFETVDRQRLSMSGEADFQENSEPTLSDVMEALRGLQQQNQELAQRLEAAEQFQNELLDQIGDDEDGDDDGDEGEDPGYEYAEEDGSQWQAGGRPMAGAGAQGSPMVPAAAGAELQALRREVHYLATKDRAETEAAELAERQHAFDIINAKVNKLVEFNIQLRTENEALMEALKTSDSRALHFSADANGRPATHVNSKSAPSDEWEEKVHEFQAKGKTETEAIRLAVAEYPGLYQVHLGRIGVVYEMGN